MHFKNDISIRKIGDESIIALDSEQGVDYTQVISLNETAAFLLNCVIGKEFSIEDLVEKLLSEYEVDENTARRDITQIVNQLKQIGIIEE